MKNTSKTHRKKASPPPDIEVMHVEEVVFLMEEWYAMHGTHKEAARACGVSQSYFNNAMRGVMQPGPKILRGLGLVRRYEYRSEKQ